MKPRENDWHPKRDVESAGERKRNTEREIERHRERGEQWAQLRQTKTE